MRGFREGCQKSFCWKNFCVLSLGAQDGRNYGHFSLIVADFRHCLELSGQYSCDWSEYVNVIGAIREPFAREFR